MNIKQKPLNQKYLIVIVGPTAIGKTALSIALAQQFKCEIISCDSRQFYKEMSIGTAVPSDMELSQAKHHFIQTKSIHDQYTVGDFEKETISLLEQLFKNDDFAIMVGGSGLYVNAVLNGLDEFPAISATARQDLEAEYIEFGIAFLQKKFKELDSQYYQFLLENNPQTLQNPQRIKRFLEVCLTTGKPYSSFLNIQKIVRNFSPIIIGLEANRDIIYNRINVRVDQMIQNGLLDEARELYAFRDKNALKTVGYSEIFRYLKNEISLDFAIDEIKKNTRRFAKRQFTWFKKYENISWFDFDEPITKIVAFIRQAT